MDWSLSYRYFLYDSGFSYRGRSTTNRVSLLLTVKNQIIRIKFVYFSIIHYLKILKYLNPVESPQTPKMTKEVTITPNILYLIRGPPHIMKIKPKISPNRPKIEPTAIKNSTPSKTLSK